MKLTNIPSKWYALEILLEEMAGPSSYVNEESLAIKITMLQPFEKLNFEEDAVDAALQC